VERARHRGRPARLLYFYAFVEAGIGLYALLFPTLFGVAQHLSLLVPINHDAYGFAFDVALSALLIGPPSVMMGGTIPILTLALAGNLENATRVHAWIYGANTIGAFAGALAAGFFLVPLLGLDGVVSLMGCLNLLAAAVFARLDVRAGSVAPDLMARPSAEPVPRFAAWAGVALLAGFSMMSLQTTLNRLGALAFGSSQFTFAMVVAVFVLSIAIGSLAVSALPQISRSLVVGSQWALVCLLFPLYFAMADVTYWAHVIRSLFTHSDFAFYAYQLAAFLSMFTVLVVPIGLSGALLPLLFHQLRHEVRDLGSVAGRIYAWNTFGSLLGALLGGYVLLFWLDMHHIYRIAMAGLAAGAAMLTLLVMAPMPRFVAALLFLPTLGAILLLPAWPADQLTAGTFRTRRETPATFLGPSKFFERWLTDDVIFHDDDPTSTVSVREPDGQPENRAIVVNGKSDGALLGDYVTMTLTALLPALIGENHERCFVVGLGTGVTAGALAALDGTREVTVAEISRGVIAANPLFDEGNLGVSQNPKVEILRGDAYRALLRSAGQYDVIVSEPSNPWVVGVEMLYSREFLEAARSRLAPGGVYAQWFHLYESDPEIVELVLRTYASVFPHVSVWFAQAPDLLLLGFDRSERALDVGALEQRFREPDFAAGFARIGIESFPQLLAHELIPLGTLHAVKLEGPLHTLRHPILSDLAARAFFRNRSSWLPTYLSDQHQEVSARNSLLRRHVGGDRPFPEELFETAVREACRLTNGEVCATFFARWAVDHPGSDRLRAALAEQRRSTNANNLGIEARRLKILRSLYGGPEPETRDGVTPAEAQRLTNLFLTHYHHAVPFDRSVVDVAWDRCRGRKCEVGRLQVAEIFRGLDGVAPARELQSLEPLHTPRWETRAEPASEPDYAPTTRGASEAQTQK
jgi:spermidine synthase